MKGSTKEEEKKARGRGRKRDQKQEQGLTGKKTRRRKVIPFEEKLPKQKTKQKSLGH